MFITTTELKQNLENISYCAGRNQSNYIVTRNTKDYGKSKTKAILPHEFLEIISRNDIWRN